MFMLVVMLPVMEGTTSVSARRCLGSEAFTTVRRTVVAGHQTKAYTLRASQRARRGGRITESTG